MNAICEIRTQGINPAMTRANGQYDAIHRGMFQTEELLTFFKDLAFIPEPSRDAPASECPPVAHAKGPDGQFTFSPRKGFLVWENVDRMISPHTAAMMVAGFISPSATPRTVSGSGNYIRRLEDAPSSKPSPS